MGHSRTPRKTARPKVNTSKPCPRCNTKNDRAAEICQTCGSAFPHEQALAGALKASLAREESKHHRMLLLIGLAITFFGLLVAAGFYGWQRRTQPPEPLQPAREAEQRMAETETHAVIVNTQASHQLAQSDDYSGLALVKSVPETTESTELPRTKFDAESRPGREPPAAPARSNTLMPALRLPPDDESTGILRSNTATAPNPAPLATRPRTLLAARELATENGRTKTPAEIFAVYNQGLAQRVNESVHRFCKTEAGQHFLQVNSYPGEIKFHMRNHPDGSITDIKIVEHKVGNQAAEILTTVVYGTEAVPWSENLKRQVGNGAYQELVIPISLVQTNWRR